MNMPQQNQTTGSLKISQEVIASITKYAACEIEGIHSLADSRLPIKSLSKSGITTRPILINLNDDVAIIDVSVIVKAGYKIRTVSEELQKAVKDAIQNMTGITVSKVNVHIEGIQFQQESAQ